MNAQNENYKITICFQVERDPSNIGTITYAPETKSVSVCHDNPEIREKIVQHYNEYTPPVVIDDEEWDEDGNIRRKYVEVPGIRGIDGANYFMMRSSELYGATGIWVSWGDSQV